MWTNINGKKIGFLGLMFILFVLNTSSLAAQPSGFSVINGAQIGYADWPFDDWANNKAEFEYYLDNVCGELNTNSIRILLWPELHRPGVGQVFETAYRNALVEFVDELEKHNMTCLFWIATYTPYSLYGHQEIGPNEQNDFDNCVKWGKECINAIIDHLARQRPANKAIIAYAVGDGEHPLFLSTVDYLKELLPYARSVDNGKHLIGKEFYSTMVSYGQIIGLPSTNNNSYIEARNLYDYVDYIGFASYHFMDGAWTDVTAFSGPAMINAQNPDNKPVIFEEYGTKLNDSPEAIWLIRYNNNLWQRNCKNYLGSYFWAANARFNFPEPSWASHWQDANKPYGVGDTKTWAKVFKNRTDILPWATYTADEIRNVITDITDYSGNGNDLILAYGATKTTPGKTGRYAFWFDGNDDYAFAGGNINMNNDHLFFSAWVYPKLRKWSSTLASRTGVFEIFIDGNGHLRVWADVGNGWSLQTISNSIVSNDMWSKVNVTYDGGYWRIYLNDSLDTYSFSRGKLKGSSVGLCLGCYNANNNYFNGYLDTVILAGETPVHCGWSFDANNGNQDASPNPNFDLTVSGGSSYITGVEDDYGKALLFDGVTGYAVSNGSLYWEPSNITLDLYVKADNPGKNTFQMIASCGRDYYASGWNLYLYDNKLYWDINTDIADDDVEVRLSLDYTDTDWHHVRAYYNDDQAGLIMDGVGTGTNGNGPIVYKYDERVTLGRMAYSEEYYFDGAVDDVEIYSTGWAKSGDINASGFVNFADFAILSNGWIDVTDIDDIFNLAENWLE